MKLSTRLFTIAGKLTRMLLLMVLIRCFGVEMAASMLAALQSARRILTERFRKPTAM
jgi:hypothetical protein